MSTDPFARALALADGIAGSLVALRCRGHVCRVHADAAAPFREARRFVEMTAWMSWRVPHVMLVPCVLAGGRPAVLVATWDPRGVVIRQTVTSQTDFDAEVAPAAEALRARLTPADRTLLEPLYADDREPPDLENLEFWPEVLARLQASEADPAAPDDPGVPVAAPLAERIWPARLEDLRERLRALED